MLVSPTGLANATDLVDEPIPQPPSAAPSIEAPSTEVALIPAQHVVFSTAAAVGVRRESISSRLLAIMQRVFATSTDPSHPGSQYEPKRYSYLEDARMAREMDRL
jgi:hypothetical protein